MPVDYQESPIQSENQNPKKQSTNPDTEMISTKISAELFTTIDSAKSALSNFLQPFLKAPQDIESILDIEVFYNTLNSATNSGEINPTAIWGSIFKAIKDKTPTSINEIFSSIQIKTIKGGNLIHSTNPDNMEDPNNYINPESFPQQYWQMIKHNFIDIYSQEHPNLINILFHKVPQHINNPDTNWTFFTLFNELIGVRIIITPADGTYHASTFYVNPEYREKFGIGRAIEEWSNQIVPPGHSIHATTATRLKSISRHLETLRVITGVETPTLEINGITTEGELDWVTENNPNHINYTTKNIQTFPKQKIIELAIENATLNNGNTIFKEAKSYQSTETGQPDDMVTTVKTMTGQGYVLTRAYPISTEGNIIKYALSFEKSSPQTAPK